MQSSRQEPYVLTLLRAVARRWPLVLACTIVVPAVAFGLSLTQPDRYTSSASLLFRDDTLAETLFGSTFFSPTTDPARQGQTNAELVSLAEISRRTARVLGDGFTAKSVQSSVQAQPGSDADVIEVDATGDTPQVAARLANTYADQYIEFRRNADRQKVQQAKALIDRRLAGAPASQQDTSTRDLRNRASQLSVLSALQTGNAELVQRAAPPTQPSSPRPRRNVALGLLLGLLVGSGLAIFLDRADRRMRSAEDVSDLLELPLLGAVPRSRTLRDASPEAIAEREGVAFQMLRTNLRYFNVDRPIKSVMVTSAAAGDGKSTVSWYLAVVDAMAGQRVLLIESDLRRPSLDRMLGLEPTRGLSDVLAGQLDLRDATVSVPTAAEGFESTSRDVDVLLAGRKPPNPAQMIESRNMEQLVRQAEEEYDVVVIDTPPMSVVSDAIPLVSRVSGLVLVARLGKSTRNSLTALKDQLGNLAAPTLGVVVNDVTSTPGGYYDGYGYGDAPRRRPFGRSRRSAERTPAGRTG